MRFTDDINRHRANARRNLRSTFKASVEEVQRSITEGSELTTAPGQPVGQFRYYTESGEGRDPYVGGTLRGSFVPSFLSPWVWQTVTNLRYAPSIEDAVSYAHRKKPLILRSTEGGFHSVKKTRIGWQRIVDAMAKRHGGSDPSGATVTDIR